MSEIAELKPCPFCGGAGKIEEGRLLSFFVRCVECGVRTPDYVATSVYPALSAWNRRQYSDVAVEGLRPFAEAADIFEREYGHLMKPETGCNIRFDALCAARTTFSEATKLRRSAALDELGALDGELLK